VSTWSEPCSGFPPCGGWYHVWHPKVSAAYPLARCRTRRWKKLLLPPSRLCPRAAQMATVLPFLMPVAAHHDAAPASLAEMHLLEVLHFDSEPPPAQAKGGPAIAMRQHARLRHQRPHRPLPRPMLQLPGRRLLRHRSLCRLLSTRSAPRSCSSSTRKARGRPAATP
jgi:hypothetical protein